MYFKLRYGQESRLYHAVLFDAQGQLLFWTKEYGSKDAVINVCDIVRRQMNAATPIYDV